MPGRKKYTMPDRVVALSIVSLMILTIVLIPFLLFYFSMQMISLNQAVSLNAANTTSSIKIVFIFYLSTLIMTGIVELIFSQFKTIRTNHKTLDFILEAILMFLLYYLFVQIYCILNEGIILRNNGNLYVALFLWSLYLILHILYILSKRVHQLIINQIQNRCNKKTK